MSLYVGYHDEAPAPLARWLRRVAGVLVLVAAALGGVVAAVQQPFGGGFFEFGVEREFEGVMVLAGVPLLQVDRPLSDEPSLLLITHFGKHALEIDSQLDGRRVALRGSLIARGRRTMVEVAEGSLRDLGPGTVRPSESLGRLVVVGEIVDSKCWLGVMKPNEGKLHRACATLCLRGGVPPLLRVRDESGRHEVLLLVDAEGRPLGDRILDRVAVPVEVSGRLSRLGADLFVLSVDPRAIRRVSPEPS